MNRWQCERAAVVAVQRAEEGRCSVEVAEDAVLQLEAKVLDLGLLSEEQELLSSLQARVADLRETSTARYLFAFRRADDSVGLVHVEAPDVQVAEQLAEDKTRHERVSHVERVVRHGGPRVVADFIDGNARWREHGVLYRTLLGPVGSAPRAGFVLHTRGLGTRVFPLAQRQVEVYLWGDDAPDEPVVRTCDDKILVDQLPLVPRSGGAS